METEISTTTTTVNENEQIEAKLEENNKNESEIKPTKNESTIDDHTEVSREESTEISTTTVNENEQIEAKSEEDNKNERESNNKNQSEIKPSTIDDENVNKSNKVPTDEGGKDESNGVRQVMELTDEYHYVKNGEYTCELFKVVVHNIPPKISYGQFRQKITEILGFTPKKTKFNTVNCYAFLAFKDEEQRLEAITVLNGYEWKSNTFFCKKAGPSKDPFVREAKRKANDKEYQSKKRRLDELEGLTPEEKILHVVCPYASKPYEEQLQLKEAEMKACINKLTENMRINKIGKPWINERKDKQCLELLPIIKSPVLKHYRNKVEFTIGAGYEGKDNIVGFRLGSYKEGSMVIVEPMNCINCSQPSLDVAKNFQEFIQTLDYPSYNVGIHVGLWQQLTVRTCTTGDLMVIAQINKSYFKEEVEYEKLVELLVGLLSEENQTTKISSAYVSWSTQRNNNIDVFKHIYGDLHIKENLSSLTFRISPCAFFQVNTPGAEILYNIVKEWCDLDQEDSCVLDVCCGTGTIGLFIAKDSQIPVVGVEISEQAVEDAKHNAMLNGVENGKFICGPAEKVLRNEIRKLSKKHVIAIVDPPRNGLHKDVLHLLRDCTAINKIIYVACSPKQASDNFLGFCRNESKRYRGRPFRTVRAVPVDLFPQTPHCELIVQLERIKVAPSAVIKNSGI